MASPFVGEIKMFGGNFAPAGWMFCEGQVLPIAEYDTLFTLIGTTYGGDGQETFALPDLRGRIPIHLGNGFEMGQAGGAETVALTVDELPDHDHALSASSDTTGGHDPAANVLATSPDVAVYTEGSPTQTLSPDATTPTGGSQPHTNLQHYLCVSFIISLYGIYPSPS